MPAKSAVQYRAMQAAAHGHSTLGIPRSVGAEFVAATPRPGGLPQKARRPMGLRAALKYGRKHKRH